MVHVAVGDKDVAHAEHLRRREGVVIPQVKQEGAALPPEINVEARIPERSVHQARNKRNTHSFRKQTKSQDVNQGETGYAGREAGRALALLAFEHQEAFLQASHLVLD
jgi:hypothetical protein